MTSTKLYRPSSGTEGDFFYARWCQDCIHDKDHREDPHKRGCEIIMRTFLYEVGDPKYPREWIYGDRGPECTAFKSDSEVAVKRCELTADMFEGRRNDNQ